MGLKRDAMRNTLGEHIVNLMGTCWELEGNIERTRWEQRKNEQNQGTLSACFSLPIGCMYLFLVSKTVRHHFWPGLMAGFGNLFTHVVQELLNTKQIFFKSIENVKTVF
jgi:hypothetical protein